MLVLCMHRTIQHMHDICVIHIRRNSVRSCLKLLVAKSVGLSAIVRVRARDRDFFFF